MCAQPHDPGQINDNHADLPAPVELEQQKRPESGHRSRGGAGKAGRNLVVRGVRRDPPDIRKLARVVASLAADMLDNEAGEQPPHAEPDAVDARAPNRRHAA